MKTRAVTKPYHDKKMLMVFLYLVAFGLLLVLYGYYIAPFWEYAGFPAELNGVKIVAAAAVIVLFVLATPTEMSVRSFFLNVVLCRYLLPTMTLYAYADQPTSAAAVIWIALSVVYAVSALPVMPASLFDIKVKPLMWTFVLMTVGLMAALYFLGGGRYFNLNLARVYDFRRDAAAALPGFFGYLLPTFSSIIIPFGIAVSLMYKNHFITLILIILSILLFGFTSHKSTIFLPFMVIIVYFMVNYINKISVIIKLFTAGLLIGVISTFLIYHEYFYNLFSWYNTLIIRRLLMVPSLLEYQYIDFFSHNPYYYWSSSRLTFGLVTDPYGMVAPRVIGEAYYQNAEQSANTGFIGSGFSQAGIWGVLLYSVGVGLVLSILQAYGHRLGTAFVVTTMIRPVMSMISSTDFVTLFLTHGMLLSLVLLAMVRPPGAGRKRHSSRTISPPTDALGAR